jgi:hypothetical protein
MEADQLHKAEQLRLSLTNQALKLGLERVKRVPQQLTPSRADDTAESLVETELLNMLYSDAVDYPIE